MYQVVALVLTLGLVVLLALGVPVGMALAIAGCLGFLAVCRTFCSYPFHCSFLQRRS